MIVVAMLFHKCKLFVERFTRRFRKYQQLKYTGRFHFFFKIAFVTLFAIFQQMFILITNML